MSLAAAGLLEPTRQDSTGVNGVQLGVLIYAHSFSISMISIVIGQVVGLSAVSPHSEKIDTSLYFLIPHIPRILSHLLDSDMI